MYKALGIFGKLKEKQEKYFNDLEKQFGKPKDYYNHLSVVINNEVEDTEKYVELLKELKQFLPLNLAVARVIMVKKDLALAFDINQTGEIRKMAKKYFEAGVIETHYVKVIRGVAKENLEKVKELLKETKEMVFEDFGLYANEINKKGIIDTTKKLCG